MEPGRHTDPQGRGPTVRVKAFPGGGRFDRVGENIAAARKGVSWACTAWRRSPPHRANLLDRGYSAFGGGFARGGPYGNYYVEVFARLSDEPTAAPGTVRDTRARTRPSSLVSMRSIALLVNPDSGRSDTTEVERLMVAAGAEVRSFELSEWRDAARSGCERLVVAGGDGSLACAARGAAEAGVPLAIIATGTANDFASELGLPDEIDEAAALAAGGERLRPLELGWVGKRPFLNLASVGLAPAAAEHAGELKERLGDLAYPAGALRASATAETIRCRVSCDEEGEPIFEGEAWQVSVACSGAFGGGSSIDADPGDGRLDLVVIEGAGRARLAKHAYGLRRGTIEDQEGVRSARCERIELRTEQADEGCLNVDGELIEAGELTDTDGAIRFRADPAAFELVVG